MMEHVEAVESLIFQIRGVRVILDADLATVYGVETRTLNQAVKRNADRFPEDFVFQLAEGEWDALQGGFGEPDEDAVSNKPGGALRSQNVILKKKGRGQHRKYMPYAFTEHGAIMAASVLKSPQAVAMSVFVVRAFVKMREKLAANAEILKRLAEIDKSLLEHDQAIRMVWEHLQPLLLPPEEKPRPKIGFHGGAS